MPDYSLDDVLRCRAASTAFVLATHLQKAGLSIPQGLKAQVAAVIDRQMRALLSDVAGDLSLFETPDERARACFRFDH
jgi:hypothetical protein